MTELMRLIQGHLDKYGVTRAEFARRAGTTPQTVQNWKDRPTTLPRREHLEGVARVIGVALRGGASRRFAGRRIQRQGNAHRCPHRGLSQRKQVAHV